MDLELTRSYLLFYLLSISPHPPKTHREPVPLRLGSTMYMCYQAPAKFDFLFELAHHHSLPGNLLGICFSSALLSNTRTCTCASKSIYQFLEQQVDCQAYQNGLLSMLPKHPPQTRSRAVPVLGSMHYN